MNNDQAKEIDKQYFTAFATDRLKRYGEAKRLALHQLVEKPDTPKKLKKFARVYLKQIAQGAYITEAGSPAHKAWVVLSEGDQKKFWETVGDGERNTPYRKAQRSVLRRLANQHRGR